MNLTIATLLMVSALTASPLALAAPNNGGFQRSIEAKKIDNFLCDTVRNSLAVAEKEADKRAGTKAAEKWSKLADSWWETGVDLGCSWAT